MSDDTPDDTPYIEQFDSAAAVLDDQTTSDKAQRSAAARIKRLRGRDPTAGVAVFDFDTLPGRTLRIYCSRQWRVDTADDDRLVTLLADPFAPVDVAEYARLVTRPFYMLKQNDHPNAYRPPGTTAFYIVRQQKYSAKRGRDVAEPFEAGDRVVLFDELTRRPVATATVEGVARPERAIDSASGTIALRMFNSEV